MHYLLSILFIVFSTPLLANDGSCSLAKYKTYALAQENWQKDLSALVTDPNPELKEIANLYLQDQLILIQKRLIAVSLLLKKYPMKLKTDQKINHWLQLNIIEEEQLAKEFITYDRLLKTAQANIKREPHQYGDKLREVMRTKIMPSKGFKQLYAKFSEKINAINSSICPAI